MVRPGSMFRHDGEVHFILAVKDDKALVLHVSDGLSRTWLVCDTFKDSIPIDAMAFFRERRAADSGGAEATAIHRGIDSCIRQAQRAGVWEALERIAEAFTLKAPEDRS